MGAYGRHVGALLRRNLLYRKRTWFGSLVQLVLPALMISILLIIKETLKDDDFFKPKVIPAQLPNTSMKTFTFLDYVTAVKTKRQCEKMPLNMKIRIISEGERSSKCTVSGVNPLNWPVPFLKCDSRKCDLNGSKCTNTTAVCEVLTLAIAPAKTDERDRAEAFERYIYETYPQIDGTNMIRRFDSSEDIDTYVRDVDYGNINETETFPDPAKPSIAVAVIFGGSEKDYVYSIRANSTNFNVPAMAGRPAMQTHPNTKRSFDSTARNPKNVCQLEGGTSHNGKREDRCTSQYMYNGVLPIQRLVDDFILHDTGANVRVGESGVSFADFPSQEFVRDGFYAQIGPYASLLLVLGLLYPVASVIRSVVTEKELRQKELMKMLSITESAIELSWFISSFSFFAIAAIFSSIVSSLLYPLASFGLLFVFWQIGFLSIVLFSLAVAAWFSKSTRATLVGILLFFGGYILTLVSDFQTGSATAVAFISIHPLSALAYGIEIIGTLEEAGFGVNAKTYNFTDNPSGLTFSLCISYLLRNSIIWGFLMWHTNRIVPGDYGRVLPWYFPFTRSYWCGGKQSEENLEEWEQHEKYGEVPIESVGNTFKEQEREGKGVHIRGLCKSFDGLTAVDELDLSIYNGQVFSLLGHNGAGKTTTISMLTGMMAPSKGYAIINGKDIRTQMQEIREDLGICLQHDCLFPLLTVKEHVRFFSRIKGLYVKKTFKDAEIHVEDSIKDVALYEKRNTFSKDLSGGMKRKLSLAIAFCGDSKVVFLDEPTSGMDPFSRRFIWDVIRRNKQDRAIVLTTHFMDEADLLGDRIAIMAKGHLRCVGSSLFLKKVYGVGYHLTIGTGIKPTQSENDVLDIVQNAVAEASVVSNSGSEITFRLPLDASDRFPPMFTQLEHKVDSQEISTYGVSITTLEEVFLMVTRGETKEENTIVSSASPSNDEEAAGPSSVERGSSEVHDLVIAGNEAQRLLSSNGCGSQSEIFRVHVQSLFHKRALNFKRDKKAWVCSIILPVLLSLLSFINVTIIAQDRNMQPLELKPSDYAKAPSSQILLPINEAESFTCQPAECLASLGSDFYEENSYCGNMISLDDMSEQCSNVSVINSLSDSSLSKPVSLSMEQNVTSILEASKSILQSTAEEIGYGALYFTHSPQSVINSTQQQYKDKIESLCNANRTSIFGQFNCSTFVGLGYVVSTNFVALHASLVYQLLADQTIIRNALDDDEYTIKATIHPLPITKTESKLAQAENSFLAWFSLILSFPFIAGTFGTFIVQERNSKAKHLQTVAGVKPSAYWLSSFVWDMINYQFPLWIIVMLMFALGVDAFITPDYYVRSATIFIMFLFGPAVAGFTYIITFLFKTPSACNMFVIVFNFFIGLAGAMVVLILRFIYLAQTLSGGTSNLKLVAQIIEWILRFVPSFCLAKGLLFSINITSFVLIEGRPLNAWSDIIMGTEIIFLAFESVLYLVLAIYIDIWSTRPAVARWFSRRSVQAPALLEEDDSDVVREAERVDSGDASTDNIVLHKLTKQYPNGKLAVNGLSIGIPSGEIFGLLGINGAGKTTTMGILTAEFPPTSGDALLATYSVTSKPEETRKRTGYCPQFDAHFNNMTGFEHVKLYAAIKGLSKDVIDEAVNGKLTEVGLSEVDRHRLSNKYSGGMKRKLSVACATIADPEIVFLDEPSTGMDPASRRDLWKVISNMVNGSNGSNRTCSVILTTHSMEECETLCPRIGIMAEGKLRCIGSAQRLKSRFGEGYQVELKVLEPTKDDEDLNEIIGILLQFKSQLPSADVESEGRDEIYFTLDEASEAAQTVTGDNSISDKISLDDLAGSIIFKSASSEVGVELNELAAFCAGELRLKALPAFFAEEYPTSILREIQDSRMRFEIPSKDLRVSSLFSSIEENKRRLNLADYGISQTTLEQVFNMHAASAEAKKQGTDDG